MDDRDLLRLHVEAVWDLSLPALDRSAQEFIITQHPPPWSVYVATLAAEEVVFWHPDVVPEQRAPLLERARQAGDVWEATIGMHHEIAFHPPVVSPQQVAQAQRCARILTTADAELIEAFEPQSAQIFLKPHNAPCIGAFADGRIVSIAHSSRQTPAACELGIDTLPAARRHGYATAATTLWTAIVQQNGRVPIYSAFAWNIASLRLAQRVGYVPRITGVYGPLPEEGG